MSHYKYRIRGYCRSSEREEYITRTRYKTKGEAEANKDAFAPIWKNIRVIKVLR
jgi:hypothetical protein